MGCHGPFPPKKAFFSYLPPHEFLDVYFCEKIKPSAMPLTDLLKLSKIGSSFLSPTLRLRKFENLDAEFFSFPFPR